MQVEINIPSHESSAEILVPYLVTVTYLIANVSCTFDYFDDALLAFVYVVSHDLFNDSDFNVVFDFDKRVR